MGTLENTSLPRVGGVVARVVIPVKPVQLRKAELPIEVTLLGMVMDESLKQRSNASSPIEVTVLGIIVFMHP